VTPADKRDYIRKALDALDPASVAQLRALSRSLPNVGTGEEDGDVAVAVAAALCHAGQRYVWKAVTDRELRDALPVELTPEEIRRGRDLFAAWLDPRSRST